MGYSPPLTQMEIQFIKENKSSMRICDIAKELNRTPSCVCQVVKGKRGKLVEMKDFFDVDYFKKQYYNY